MSKATGLGWTTFSVDDSGGTARAIINDIHSLSWKMPRAVQETTGIDKSAIERLLLLADLSYDIAGIFNAAASTGAHTVLSTVSISSANRTVTNVVNAATLAAECVLTSYDVKRSNKGELTWDSKLMLADGTVPTWS
jgi:hypothetical protein